MRRVLNVIAVLLGIVLLAVVGLAVAIVVDRGQGPGRLAALANVTAPGVSGPDVAAYVARPSGAGPHPAVILIHEFWGLRDDMVAKADLLAAQGYVVVAPDLFRGVTTDFLPTAIYNVVSTPAETQNADLAAVYAWLVSQPDVDVSRVAVAGFCFGGGASLRYSLTNPDLAATVVFYGQVVTDPAQLAQLPGPVLGIFGGADSSIPLDQVQAFEAGLEQAAVPHTISIYDGQPHAFVTTVDAIAAGGAPGEAWAQMLAFLDENLKRAPGVVASPARSANVPDDRWAYAFRLAWSHLFETDSHSHH